MVVPTIISGLRARGVYGRVFDIFYNTVKMRNWDVLRSSIGLPGLLRKSEVDILDFTDDMSLVTTPAAFLEVQGFNAGDGDRNSVRLRDIKIKNTATNLSYLVEGGGLADARVSSSGVEAAFPPVSGVMSHAFHKQTNLSFLADYV